MSLSPADYGADSNTSNYASSNESSASSLHYDHKRPGQGQAYSPPLELFERYQLLLESTMPAVPLLLPTQHVQAPLSSELTGEEEQHLSKAEKERLRKKKQKERNAEKAAVAASTGTRFGDSTLVDFRLFSSCPVLPISIQPKAEVYPVPNNPRHLPLTPNDTATLRARAQEAAVEYPNLGGPSRIADKWARRSYRLPQFTRDTILSGADGANVILGTISQSRAVAEHPTTTYDVPPSRNPRGAGKSRKQASPSVSKANLYRNDTSIGGLGTKPRTRRKPRKQVVRASPKYFTPPKSMGGKSMTTLWGYGWGMD